MTMKQQKHKHYIISDDSGDFLRCTIDNGYTLKYLRGALKTGYEARLAKQGEGEGLPQKHYSSLALMFW